MDQLAALERRVLKPWPLRGRERKICALVLVCLLFGVTGSLLTGCSQWMEWSGALVVVVGIYFAWLDLSSPVGGVRLHLDAQIKALLSEYTNTPAEGLIVKAVRQEAADEVSREVVRLQRLLGSLGKRIKAMEAAVLALGTLVWGFGGAFVGNGCGANA